MSFSNLRKLKDEGLSAGIKRLLQSELEPFGTVTDLNIDSANKSMHLSLALKGETSPLEIRIHDYEIVKEQGATVFRFGEIESSREWINQLIQSYLPADKKFIALPSGIATAASFLL